MAEGSFVFVFAVVIAVVSAAVAAVYVDAVFAVVVVVVVGAAEWLCFYHGLDFPVSLIVESAVVAME